MPWTCRLSEYQSQASQQVKKPIYITLHYRLTALPRRRTRRRRVLTTHATATVEELRGTGADTEQALRVVAQTDVSTAARLTQRDFPD